MSDPGLGMHKRNSVELDDDDEDEDDDDGEPMDSQHLPKIKLKMNSGLPIKKHKRIHEDDDEEDY